MRDRGFPQRYTDKELGAMKYEILWWFSIQWVSFFLPGNAKQLIIVGPSGSQIKLLFRLLSCFYRVAYIPPTLDSFIGIEEDSDLWVIEGCSPEVFSKRWARSLAGILFERMLGGENMTFQWGLIRTLPSGRKGAYRSSWYAMGKQSPLASIIGVSRIAWWSLV